jgi:hypothetical protein
MGFQWGYRVVDDGTIEYTIQLRPEEVGLLATSGEEILSYVPSEAQPVGRVRIVVGTGPLARGAQITETQLRTVRPSEPGKDAAGRLVAVQPAASANDNTSGGLQLRTPGGAALNDGDAGLPNATDDPAAATDDAASQGQPLPREALREPVHVVGNPAGDASGVPPFDEGAPPVRKTALAEESPSDFSQRGAAGDRGNNALAPDDPQDRPWLPLVVVAAVAVGFLAGNVFQWRSYVSLRKRYLHLLRKTGG